MRRMEYDIANQSFAKVYGKYEGVVCGNRDPLFGGRLEVRVPDILGSKKVWARPCVPYAARDMGLHLIPPVDALVWIEFLGGDKDQPIWTGCYWKNGEVPTRDVGEMVLATPSGTLRFNSKSPRADIRLDLEDGTALTITGKSIVIDTGAAAKVELSSSSVSVNSGALEVK